MPKTDTKHISDRSAKLSFRIQQIIKNPSVIKRRLYSQYIAPFYSDDRKGSVAMFHIGRCGSTVLSNLLDQNSDIFWDGEIYSKHFITPWLKKGVRKEVVPIDAYKPTTSPEKLLRNRMKRSGRAYYGFEVKPFHIHFFDLSIGDYIEILKEIGITNFIILERKNYLRVILSSLILHKKKSHHVLNSENTTLTKINININEVLIDCSSKSLIDLLNFYDSEYSKIKCYLDNENTIYLNYEDDICNDPNIGYERLCTFLNVEKGEPSIKLKKVNPFKLTEMIENYHEVKRVLSDTKFLWMLDGAS